MKNQKQKMKNRTLWAIFLCFFLTGLFLATVPADAAASPAGNDELLGDVNASVPDSAMPVWRNTQGLDKNSGSPDLFRSGVRMVTSLIVVIGIMLLIAYGTKRFLARRGTLPGKETMIRILATRYLGAKNSLSVVDVDGERFVIGISPQGISFLTTLCDLSGTEGVEDGEKTFHKVLRRNLNE